MRVKAGRNLVLPTVKDFYNMGLRRSHKYKLLTYAQILRKYGVEDSLATARGDYAQKVYSYAIGEFFLVPSGIPQQDWKPIKQSEQTKRAINVGKEGLLEKFAQLFYSTKWEIPQDGSIRQYIDDLNNLPRLSCNEYKDKALEWTNKYGLLFNEPMPQSLIENTYNYSCLPFSDAFYNYICAEKKNIPYFLGVQAFHEINIYSVILLFVTWLYSQDNKLLEKVGHGNNLTSVDADICNTALRSIIDGYMVVNPARARYYGAFLNSKNIDENRLDERRIHFRAFAIKELTRQMSVWIKLEMPVQIKKANNSIRELAVRSQYQCSSIFAAMMIEALSGLNNVSRYRVCEKCKNIFDIGNGRSDRKYCSEECKELARYKREREARRSQD